MQVKLCDPRLSALKWFVYHARRYTSARLYLLLIRCRRNIVVCVCSADKALLEDAKHFTVLIKNYIEFPKFKQKR